METYQKKKSNLKWWILIVLFLVLIIGPAVFIIMSKSQLNKRLDQMRAEGIPTTFAELEEYCRLPTDMQNAADLYQQAFGVLSEPSQDTMELLPAYSLDMDKLEMPLSDETQTAINDHLTANKDCLDLIYQAAEIKDCHFPFQYSPQGDILLLHLSELRNFMRLLTCQMITQAQNNDTEKMIANFRAQAAVADTLKNEPVLISYLVRIACWSMFSKNVEFALNNVSFSKDHLTQLQSLLPDLDQENGLRQSLIGEQCFVLEVAQNPQQLQSNFPGAARIFMNSTGLLDKNCLKYLDIMEQYQAVTKLNPKEQLLKLKDLDNQVENLSFIYLFVKMIFPALNRVCEINMRYQANIINTHTALAAEQYITETGNIPESLDMLVDKYLDKVPADLDGRPLRYTTEKNSYTIYSVGHDMQDNKGIKRDEKNRSKPHDIPFTVLKQK